MIIIPRMVFGQNKKPYLITFDYRFQNNKKFQDATVKINFDKELNQKKEYKNLKEE
jgi:hypothetical protein